MKTYIILLGLLVTVLSCKQKSFETDGVQYSGNLRDVMSGDIEATITLNELKSMKNLYALGAVEGLDGEVQIFNSQPFISKRESDKIKIERNFQSNAAMLVYAQVPEWHEIEVPKAIYTLKQFEPFLTHHAEQAGIDTSKPFPFMLEGNVRKLSWHIVKFNPEVEVRSMMDHMKMGLNGVTVEEKAEILGFYSKDHQGVFTHHDSNMHLHFRTENEALAGHADDLILGAYMTLKLPKQ